MRTMITEIEMQAVKDPRGRCCVMNASWLKWAKILLIWAAPMQLPKGLYEEFGEKRS